MTKQLCLARKGLFITLLSCPAWLSGCAETGSAEELGRRIDETLTRPAREVESARRVVADSTLTAQAKAEIVRDPWLRLFRIQVTTTDGVVKLEGIVDSQHSIDKATEIVRAVPGVLGVENNLVIRATEQAQ